MTAVPLLRIADALASLGEDEIIRLVEQALIDFADGRAIAPPPGLLRSEAPPGDCHIKYAMSRASGLIVVKVATGFYDNPASGRPVNDGLVNVFSAATGEALCVLLDGGLLTGARTAAAGIVAARLGRSDPQSAVGIVGTGHQAALQAAWSSRHLTSEPVRLLGRSAGRPEALAADLARKGIEAIPFDDIAGFCASCDTIILCTSSSVPILHAGHLRPGHHIVSLGADGPGKMELSASAYGLAAAVAVDDLAQARERSDLRLALVEGALEEASVLPLGRLLSDRSPLRRSDADVTIVNLCGSAATDLALVAPILATSGAMAAGQSL